VEKFGADLTIVDYCFLLYFFLFTVHTVSPIHDLCNWKSGAEILGTRSPCWLNFGWWYLIFENPQYGTSFMSSFCCLKFDVSLRPLESLCTPGKSTVM